MAHNAIGCFLNIFVKQPALEVVRNAEVRAAVKRRQAIGNRNAGVIHFMEVGTRLNMACSRRPHDPDGCMEGSLAWGKALQYAVVELRPVLQKVSQLRRVHILDHHIVRVRCLFLILFGVIPVLVTVSLVYVDVDCTDFVGRVLLLYEAIVD